MSLRSLLWTSALFASFSPVASVLAQGPVPYLVTKAPLDVGVRLMRLCIAVRNSDVWWWQGGQNGCETRTSNVVQADRVMITTTQTDRRFTFALPPTLLSESANGDGVVVAVILRAEGDTLSSVGPNGAIAQVALFERPNVDIPEQR
jgi:hypothetical protein